jgi:hypothetical protein
MMLLKLVPLLLLVTALMLLVGCDRKSEPVSSHTPPTQVPSKARITPTPEFNSIQAPWGLLASLSVDLPAIFAAGQLLGNQQGRENDIDLKPFTSLSMPKPGSPEKVSHQL